MIPRGRGAILLTGASASIKGFPLSCAFAMGNLRCGAWPRVRLASWGPKAFTSHTSLLMAQCEARGVRTPPNVLTVRLIRIQLPSIPGCTQAASRCVVIRGWNYGLGSKASDQRWVSARSRS